VPEKGSGPSFGVVVVCIVVGPSENNEGTWLRRARR
jgi:hypothetical protein